MKMIKQESLKDSMGDFTNIKDLPGLFPDRVKLMLGENADQIIINIFVGLSSFAPSPATFDRNAFESILIGFIRNDMNLEVRSEDVLNFSVSTGLIEKEESRERFRTMPFISETMKRLFTDDFV